MEKLKRIQENSISSSDVKTSSYYALVTIPESGIFILSQFALIQFFKGPQNDKEFGDLIPQSYFSLIGRLAEYSMSPAFDEVGIELDNKEVQILKILLEARMRHCEVERDNMNPAFNPDTYISQKLLLLDLREWLMVHSITLMNEEVGQAVAKMAH